MSEIDSLYTRLLVYFCPGDLVYRVLQWGVVQVRARVISRT